MDYRPLIPALIDQSYFPYYQNTGKGGEGRSVEHSVHRCQTAAALQVRLMEQMIVSYGAILSCTVCVKKSVDGPGVRQRTSA
jgi:hypothetical protein